MQHCQQIACELPHVFFSAQNRQNMAKEIKPNTVQTLPFSKEPGMVNDRRDKRAPLALVSSHLVAHLTVFSRDRMKLMDDQVHRFVRFCEHLMHLFFFFFQKLTSSQKMFVNMFNRNTILYFRSAALILSTRKI